NFVVSSVSASSTATSSESLSALVLSVPDSSTSAVSPAPVSSTAASSESVSALASFNAVSSTSASASSSSVASSSDSASTPTSASSYSVRFSVSSTVFVSYIHSITCLAASPLEYTFQSSQNDCTLSNIKFSPQIVSIN